MGVSATYHFAQLGLDILCSELGSSWETKHGLRGKGIYENMTTNYSKIVLTKDWYSIDWKEAYSQVARMQNDIVVAYI